MEQLGALRWRERVVANTIVVGTVIVMVNGGASSADSVWSNSKAEWINTKPMTCEENLLKQAQLIKANNTLKGQKIWVYRNPVLAMPWMSSTAKIMNDPAYDVWFLKFAPGADGR
eukprot:COSAG02_NODE_17498_length_999_cov_1.318889_2_plen_115_part_00